MTTTKNLCALALSMCSPLGLTCENPPLVAIPEVVATDAEKSVVRLDTDIYIAGIYAYVDCIKAELDAAGEQSPEVYRALLVARNNQAVAEVAVVVELFEARVGPLQPEEPPAPPPE